LHNALYSVWRSLFIDDIIFGRMSSEGVGESVDLIKAKASIQKKSSLGSADLMLKV
jgi:hypothetical protein